MLKMGELLRHGDIDELVERDAFFQREILRNPTHRGHEPERKFVHDNFLLACGHTFISSSSIHSAVLPESALPSENALLVPENASFGKRFQHIQEQCGFFLRLPGHTQVFRPKRHIPILTGQLVVHEDG
jgi:hypothetical protein